MELAEFAAGAGLVQNWVEVWGGDVLQSVEGGRGDRIPHQGLGGLPRAQYSFSEGANSAGRDGGKGGGALLL